MHRALPDVRDGLKPVHRRIVYAMREMRLNPTGGYKKSAKVVGEVMGNFHPHGDQSIYDALVRLAQDFAVRYPLVDGQGNFGNVDGDNPAAMRYTEARMTAVAELLLRGIDEDAVDFRPTYDGEGEEPVVLPGAFPNLLANGSAGIAVGMATNIPPHNVAELCDAALHLIKFPNATLAKLMEFVPGPDFPTGGIIVSIARDAGGDLQDRARRHPRPRALGDGGSRPRHLGGGRHRDSLPGAEEPADRGDRRADREPQAAARRRRARRERGGRAHRHRAEEPHGRSGADDGIALPHHASWRRASRST